MILIFLVATPLFTTGTDLIEAGAVERGVPTLEALYSTPISLEMKNRILYNLGVAALDQSVWNEALSNFQQIEGDEGDLTPFINEGIEIALSRRPKQSFQTLSTLPNPLTLSDTTKQVALLIQNLSTFPFHGGENTQEYSLLKERLQQLLDRKTEWWNSVVQKEEEDASKGCFLTHWEEVVQRLGEGTLSLERALQGFNNSAKPYATLYPQLKEALSALLSAATALGTELKGGGQEPGQTERFQTLSEMFRKDRQPEPPIPKGALW